MNSRDAQELRKSADFIHFRLQEAQALRDLLQRETQVVYA